MADAKLLRTTVEITAVCLGCRTEQVMRIPRERGIKSGRYSWECFGCQDKRYGVLGCGRQGDHKEDWRYDGKRSFGKALHYGLDLIHFSAFGK